MSFSSSGETTKAERSKVAELLEKYKERLPKSRAVLLGIPALIVAGFLVTASFLPNACAVMIDGKEVAVVKDQALAESVLQETCAGLSSEQEVFTEKDLTFNSVRLRDRELVSEEELSQIYLANLDFATEATAITVDGEIVAWVKDEITAQQAKEKFQASFSREDAECVSFEWKSEIAFENGKTAPENILDCDCVVTLLKTGSDKLVTHTVAKGDTLWSIAKANDTSVAEILKANPGLNENSVLALGSQIKLSKVEPLVDVECVYIKKVRGEIEFKTELVEDKNLAAGQTKVKQEGQNGEKEVVYRFRTLNGVKVGQETLSTTVIKEPVTKIVASGTRAYLASRGSARSSGSSSSGSYSGGSLRWPTTATRISQGYRSGHRAIDIDGNTGDPVYASASGTVSFAGWSGGYGKCILIKHGNGLTTRYAHCSSLSVSAGDTVSAGTVIGKVGSTGRSTGSHLHYEVIVSGTQRNPMSYLR